MSLGIADFFENSGENPFNYWVNILSFNFNIILKTIRENFKKNQSKKSLKKNKHWSIIKQ